MTVKSATPSELRHISPRQINTKTDTRDILAHATKQARQGKYDDYFIVDLDSHHIEEQSWDQIIPYVTDPVLRRYAEECGNWLPPGNGLSNASPGLRYQDVAGRIPHQQGLGEDIDDTSVHRDVVLARRAMEALGSSYMVVFPQPMLLLGMHPQPEVEVALSFAYNRWFCEQILAADSRLKALIYLPFGHVDACIETIEEFGEKPGVIGFTIASTRYQKVQGNQHMRIYAMLEERGMPIAFHAAHNWGDSSMRMTDRFLSMHALSFVLCNMVHLTNWVIHGLPERFPKLKPIWIESGLAWVPFMMQRLDNEYMMRQSEAPLLKRRPSEYIREMYFSSQPMEVTDMAMLESTFRAINAETQVLYSSDWPHWDFDLPSTIFDIPFLDEQAKRNILGLNARRLFDLDR